ncbi:MAG: hypothetical protein ACJAW3_001126 [Lentimonas sp.]|jgi:hypothetical protein
MVKRWISRFCGKKAIDQEGDQASLLRKEQEARPDILLYQRGVL